MWSAQRMKLSSKCYISSSFLSHATKHQNDWYLCPCALRTSLLSKAPSQLWQFKGSTAEIGVTETQSHGGRVSLQLGDDKRALKADSANFCQKRTARVTLMSSNQMQSNQRSGWEASRERSRAVLIQSNISYKVEEELQRRAWLKPRASWHNWNCRKQSFEGSGSSLF